MRLDPRTKLFLLLMVSIFIIGGAGGQRAGLFRVLLAVLSFGLLLSTHSYQKVTAYIVVYIACIMLEIFMLPQLRGLPNFILIFMIGTVTRFMMAILLGQYIIATTTVSEFVASMQRMHVTEKLIIPLSVVFRFFPTIGEEVGSINAAMRMRGIRAGSGNLGKMIEYRMIPMMVCSVKIGEELSVASLTRGLGGEAQRTNICRIGFGLPDSIIILFCICGMAVLLL